MKILSIVIAVTITVIVSVLAGSYFRDPIIGSIVGIIIGIFVSIPLVILIIILERLVSREKTTHQLIHRIITILAVVTVIIWNKYQWSPSPTTLFKRIVQKPIPASVTNIQSDVDYLSMGHAYRLRFNIDDSDILKIITSKNFRTVDEFYNMDAIDRHFKKVSWWNPNTIKSPKRYVADPRMEVGHLVWVDTNNHIVYYAELK